MEVWVTTKNASQNNKVGLSQHRIAQLAKHGKIVAKKVGAKKYLVKITLNDEHWELVKMPPNKMEQVSATEGLPKVNATNQEKLEPHLQKLAEIAEILAHHAQRLKKYKGNKDVRVMGDVLHHLKFYYYEKSDGKEVNGAIVGEGTDPTGELRYEEQHPIKPFLAQSLYNHYVHKFGALPFQKWEQLSIDNVSTELINNLNLLAHSGLKLCASCPICKELME
jgi:hypothetical protein